MDELDIEYVRNFLANNHFDYNPSQNKLSLPILNRIYRRLNAGKEFHPIQVCENLIINGHHRFICYEILKLEITKTAWQKNSTANNTISWNEIIVDLEDFDTDEERERYSKIYDSEQVREE